MQQHRTATDLALVAVFAALVAAFSLIPAIMLPAVPVPITFQTLAVCLAGLVLGPWRGGAAVVLWLLVGFAGAPVFSKGASTLAVMGGPTAGYLIGFLVGAVLLGVVARVVVRRLRGVAQTTVLGLAAFLASVLVFYPLGALGLMVNVHVPSFVKAYQVNLAFLPLDAVKAALAAVVATAVYRAFPRVLTGERTTAEPSPRP